MAILSHHDCPAHVRSRGQKRTRADAMTKHAIMKRNPLSNAPVCSLRLPKIFGPTNPPMLAVQLINPTAAAAAELLRNAEGNAQNEGRYATVPNPASVNTVMSSAFECGTKNQTPKASAAVNCGMAK